MTLPFMARLVLNVDTGAVGSVAVSIEPLLSDHGDASRGLWSHPDAALYTFHRRGYLHKICKAASE